MMNYGRYPSSLAPGAIAVVSLTIALLLFCTQVRAQVSGFGQFSAPIYGGTEPLPAALTNPFSTVKGNFAPIHKNASGKPCISIRASAVPQVSDRHIINHMVLVANDCGQSIKVQVCYFQRSSCILVAVSGYQKLERTLGISPGMTDFRYEYREQL
jgi:hypothetical protein